MDDGDDDDTDDDDTDDDTDDDHDDDTHDDNVHKNDSYTAAGAAPGASVPCSFSRVPVEGLGFVLSIWGSIGAILKLLGPLLELGNNLEFQLDMIGFIFSELLC